MYGSIDGPVDGQVRDLSVLADGWRNAALPLLETAEIGAATGRRRRLPLPVIEDAAKMVTNPATMPGELIDGLLHRGAKMVVGGGSKSFKTWVLLDLAMSVAMGETWLGFPTHAARVLYINLEIAGGFFAQRIIQVAKAKEVELVENHLDVWNLRGHAADIEQLVDTILEKVGDQQYGLIVVDPIYKALGRRDENKAGDIADMLNHVEQLTVQSEAAVVFGAHFSKGNQAGKDSMDRIGGSGVFARDPDTILVLTKHEEENAFVVDTTLRNHPPIAPLVVRWQFPLMRRDDNLNPTKLKLAGSRAKKYFPKDLLELLPGAGLMTNQWCRMAQENLDMGESTFHRILKELKDEGKIIESPENRRQWINAQSPNTPSASNTSI